MHKNIMMCILRILLISITTFAGVLQAYAVTGAYSETTTTSTILTGPVQDIAVNPTTNLIYVASGGTAVAVINGTTKSLVTTINTGSDDAPAVGVAVNPNTNLIYVTNRGLNSQSRYSQDQGDAGKVSVINGTTNKVDHIVPVENAPYGIAVNPVTNLVYVANGGSDSVTVINGSKHFPSHSIKTIVNNEHVAVNPVTNMVYISTAGNAVLYAINGTTNALESNVTLPNAARDIEVNPFTNKIYVATEAGTVAVYDGNTMKMIAYLWTGFCPFGIAVNPNTDRVYVTDSCSHKLSVIDGGSSDRVLNEINMTATGATGIAVNPKTNEVYVGTCACVAPAPNVTYVVNASRQDLITTNIANMSHLFVISDTHYQISSILSRNGSLVISPSSEPFLVKNNATYFVTPLDSGGKFAKLFFMNWSDSSSANNDNGTSSSNNSKVIRQISISKDTWLTANYKFVAGPFYGCDHCALVQEPVGSYITINTTDSNGSPIHGVNASLYSTGNATIIAAKPTPATFKIDAGHRYTIRLNNPTSSSEGGVDLLFDHWKDIDASGPQIDLIVNSTRDNSINATLSVVYVPVRDAR